MKRTCLLLFAGSCGLLWAQTNSLLQESTDHVVDIRSGAGYYDFKARQLVYYDNVVATNWEGKLTCGRLTILLPPEGAGSDHPTNVVAESNVVIDVLRNGDTNHITADKAIYAYSLAEGVTNETVTLTGHAVATNSEYMATGEPLVWDNIAGRFTGTDFRTTFYPKTRPGNGTNAGPFNLMK